MDERPESGYTGARPNHNYRCFLRFWENHRAFLQPNWNLINVLFNLLFKPIRANSFLFPFELCLILSNSHREMSLFRMNIKPRRYAELSGLLPSAKLNQVLNRQSNFLVRIEIIEDFNNSSLLLNAIPVVFRLAVYSF